MPGYTIKNLMQIDDALRDRGLGVEARFARSHIDSDHLGVSHFRYGPEVRSTVGHSHREQEEVYLVVAGSGRVKLDDEVIDVHQWDVVRVAPEVTRAFAAGSDGLELLVVGSDRPEGGDGVMVKDWWND